MLMLEQSSPALETDAESKHASRTEGDILEMKAVSPLAPHSPASSSQPERRAVTPSSDGDIDGVAQAYYRSMAQVRLLTGDGERAVAKRIEEGERIMLDALVRSPLARAEIAKIAAEVAAGTWRLSHALRVVDDGDDGDAEGAGAREALQLLFAKLAMLDEKSQVRVKKDGSSKASSDGVANLVEQFLVLRLHARVLDAVQKSLTRTAREKSPQGDEAKKVLESMRQGRAIADKAKGELVEANLRLVVSFANKLKTHGVPLLDLVQEGNIGLMKAAERFEYRRGYKFSTYASWWVKQAMARAVDEHSRTIRVPVHVLEQNQKIVRFVRAYIQEFGHEPTEEELSKRAAIPAEKITWLKTVMRDPVSLSSPFGQEESTTLGDVIADTQSVTTEEHVTRRSFESDVNDVLQILTDREQRILRMRFGVDRGREYTLEEVGDRLSLTRERIRQIEKNALRKLKAPANVRRLRSYLAG
jgi:RNA polymerase primary sigma factor